jgi:hypothetical protein
MIVELDINELYVALMVGGRRRIESLCAGREDTKYYAVENALESDIQAAGSELAYAKFRNVHWNAGVDTFKGPDIGTNVQIRHSKLPHASLILRPADSDDEYYVLVTGEFPIFKIVGWLKGVDAKHEEFLKSPGRKAAAWFVPQNKLKPFK